MKAVFVDCTDELAAVLARASLDVPEAVQIHLGTPSPDALDSLCKDADVLLVEHTVVPAQVVRGSPKLRAIIFMGTGAGTYLPLDLCAELGIAVVTTPGYANRAVAEHAMALLFSAARDVARMDRELRAGLWNPRGGVQLQGRKLAVIGLGEIGRTLAEMASALGLRVAGWNRSPVAAPYYVEQLEEALRDADAVSLHLALTDQTRGLIDGQRLALVRPGAILVNTARAQLVETSALKAALASGQLSHAALDVFEEEPLPEDQEWSTIDNVTLTAHAAYMTDEAYLELWKKTMCALRSIQPTS